MKNKYKLYEVDYVKGMMMYKYIDDTMAFNIIEAEDIFEGNSQMKSNYEYVITIEKS